MNNTFLEFIINLIVLVPVVVLLIFISLRLSKKSLIKIGSVSYVKVLEKINLSKDICLYVIKSGNTGCIIVTSNNNTQVIKKLNEDEINEIIEMKNQHNDLSYLNNLDFSKILNKKMLSDKVLKNKIAGGKREKMMDILSQILDNGSELTTNMQMFLLMTALMFLPTIIFMMTSFVRVIITFSFIKSALGAQQSIPNQILVGLAMCITLFIMSPVMNKVAENSIRPYMNQEITMQEAYDEFRKPVAEFLLKQTRESDLELFAKNSSIDTTNLKDEELPLSIIVPAFAISELKTAFQIGFIIYIPFLVIDLVVSSTLMSMGMFMLPPAMISLPFKLLLFVMVDGWNLLIKSLIESFKV